MADKVTRMPTPRRPQTPTSPDPDGGPVVIAFVFVAIFTFAAGMITGAVLW
jgi:hypothetical protein